MDESKLSLFSVKCLPDTFQGSAGLLLESGLDRSLRSLKERFLDIDKSLVERAINSVVDLEKEFGRRESSMLWILKGQSLDIHKSSFWSKGNFDELSHQRLLMG
ncbi:hypothetical protein L1887_38993 [Cichorium endivia]|nr:hypothetical protein L1887_38990 [Cichorium endivia]KAI3496623.1 hypothetical protein L1887_38993 [Cichorium endivia]